MTKIIPQMNTSLTTNECKFYHKGVRVKRLRTDE